AGCRIATAQSINSVYAGLLTPERASSSGVVGRSPLRRFATLPPQAGEDPGGGLPRDPGRVFSLMPESVAADPPPRVGEWSRGPEGACRGKSLRDYRSAGVAAGVRGVVPCRPLRRFATLPPQAGEDPGG